MRNSPHVSDPFSDILMLTSARTVMTGGLRAGGRWALRFPAPTKLKFSAVVHGECWAAVDGQEPIRATRGEAYLLSLGRTLVMGSDLSIKPVDALKVFTPQAGRFPRLGTGDDFSYIGGHVELDPESAIMLAEVLPPLIRVPSSSKEAIAVQWLVEQLLREQDEALAGASVAASHLAQLVFVQILRSHFESNTVWKAGWLRAVTDKELAPALRLMHGEPGRDWQLVELAKASGMSRTTFAEHFKQAAGIAPLSYLTQWRMRLAQRAMRESNPPLSELSQQLGYSSESAFSNAFKRVTGSSPRSYRTQVRAQP
jgi:AraC-like DNA-binding protein